MKQLDYYKESILELARNKSTEVFYNSSAEHARIVHLAIVQTAEKYISFFCGGLSSDIINNDEYCDAMNDFLSKKNSPQVDIIFDNTFSFHELFSLFRKTNIAKVFSKHSSQVTFSYFNGKLTNNSQPVHFTFADGRMFRLETDTQNHKAFGNFNSPSQVKLLNTHFTRVKESQNTTIVNFFL